MAAGFGPLRPCTVAHRGADSFTLSIWCQPWTAEAAGSSALGGLAVSALRRDFGGLGEQRGIACPEHLAGKADRGIHLRKTERARRVIPAAQPVEQRRGPGLEIILQLGMDAQRHLVDGQLARKIAADADELDQRPRCLDLGSPLSADRGPASVRVAAGGAAGVFGPAADVDRVAVLAAAQPAALVIWSGHDGPVIGGVIAAPTDRRTRRAAFQRLHLRRVGRLAVALVHGRPDGAAEQAAGNRSDGCAGNAAARPAPAEQGAERAAGNRTGYRPGV